MLANSRVLWLLVILCPCTWLFQYYRQVELNRKIFTVTLGASEETVKEALGKPTEVVVTEGSDVYCYGPGYPLSLTQSEEWQLEIQQNKLIDKRFRSERPGWSD